MTLERYQSKRDFSKTNEPMPKKGKSSTGSLHFGVQKHAATHLHYDFRLELDGVLISWAVPKGPSMNPNDKRLAIKVEDHPLDYRLFEGVIPKGSYGAGTVELWDEGTYTVDKTENISKYMREGLKKGHVEFELHGKKLKGKFALIQLKNAEKDNQWLLIKSKDDFANASNLIVVKKKDLKSDE